MEAYEIVGTIGEGTYGVVLKARHVTSGQLVAIKKFKESDEDDGVRKTALREVRLLRVMKGVHVVRLLEAFRRRRKLHLVFELAERTLLEEMEDAARDAPGGGDADGDAAPPTCGLPPARVRAYAWQLLRGLHYLHARGVMHRDVKPENILMSANGVLKMCDFGFARAVAGPGAKYTDYVATRWYRAPELLIGDAVYGKAVDIWAAGCVIAEMATGVPLFPGDSDTDMLVHIARVLGNMPVRLEDAVKKTSRFAGFRLPRFQPSELEALEQRLPGVDDACADLIKRCLKYEPLQRPTAADLLQHPYFAELETHYLPVFKAAVAADAAMSVLGRTVPIRPGKELLHGDSNSSDPGSARKEDDTASTDPRSQAIALRLIEDDSKDGDTQPWASMESSDAEGGQSEAPAEKEWHAPGTGAKASAGIAQRAAAAKDRAAPTPKVSPRPELRTASRAPPSGFRHADKRHTSATPQSPSTADKIIADAVVAVTEALSLVDADAAASRVRGGRSESGHAPAGSIDEGSTVFGAASTDVDLDDDSSSLADGRSHVSSVAGQDARPLRKLDRPMNSGNILGRHGRPPTVPPAAVNFNVHRVGGSERIAADATLGEVGALQGEMRVAERLVATPMQVGPGFGLEDDSPSGGSNNRRAGAPSAVPQARTAAAASSRRRNHRESTPEFKDSKLDDVHPSSSGGALHRSPAAVTDMPASSRAAMHGDARTLAAPSVGGATERAVAMPQAGDQGNGAPVHADMDGDIDADLIGTSLSETHSTDTLDAISQLTRDIDAILASPSGSMLYGPNHPNHSGAVRSSPRDGEATSQSGRAGAQLTLPAARAGHTDPDTMGAAFVAPAKHRGLERQGVHPSGHAPSHSPLAATAHALRHSGSDDGLAAALLPSPLAHARAGDAQHGKQATMGASSSRPGMFPFPALPSNTMLFGSFNPTAGSSPAAGHSVTFAEEVGPSGSIIFDHQRGRSLSNAHREAAVRDRSSDSTGAGMPATSALPDDFAALRMEVASRSRDRDGAGRYPSTTGPGAALAMGIVGVARRPEVSVQHGGLHERSSIYDRRSLLSRDRDRERERSTLQSRGASVLGMTAPSSTGGSLVDLSISGTAQGMQRNGGGGPSQARATAAATSTTTARGASMTALEVAGAAAGRRADRNGGASMAFGRGAGVHVTGDGGGTAYLMTPPGHTASVAAVNLAAPMTSYGRAPATASVAPRVGTGMTPYYSPAGAAIVAPQSSLGSTGMLHGSMHGGMQPAPAGYGLQRTAVGSPMLVAGHTRFVAAAGPHTFAMTSGAVRMAAHATAGGPAVAMRAAGTGLGFGMAAVR